MSELQLALIGFGALAVAAIWGFNAWQQKRHRRQAETVLPQAARADVLMAGRESLPSGRSEPVLEVDAVPPAPTFLDDAVQEAARSTPQLPAEWADGQADCLLRIEFVDAVPVSSLWPEQANWSGAIDKPMQWLGFDEQSGRWRKLLAQDGGHVNQLAVAIQLADRRGPLGESALGTFLGGVHRLAQRFSGLVELPEQSGILARARELDAFCASLDLQLSLHVLPRPGSLSPMQGARLKPLLEAAGLQLEGERFIAVDAAGSEMFSLTCEAATPFVLADYERQALTQLTLGLDVPRVADGAAALDRMMAFGRQCAETLGSQLTDARKQPLAEATLQALRTRIAELQIQMTQAGFAPGSVRALRLFS